MADDTVCLDCGASLVVEYIGSYGTVYRLRRDGTVGARMKSIKYEHSGDYMVYCPKCGHGFEGEFKDGVFQIRGRCYGG